MLHKQYTKYQDAIQRAMTGTDDPEQLFLDVLPYAMMKLSGYELETANLEDCKPLTWHVKRITVNHDPSYRFSTLYTAHLEPDFSICWSCLRNYRDSVSNHQWNNTTVYLGIQEGFCICDLCGEQYDEIPF